MDETSLKILNQALIKLNEEKPTDRTDLDRRYAIMITDLEKIIAYHNLYVGTYYPPKSQ